MKKKNYGTLSRIVRRELDEKIPQIYYNIRNYIHNSDQTISEFSEKKVRKRPPQKIFYKLISELTDEQSWKLYEYIQKDLKGETDPQEYIWFTRVRDKPLKRELNPKIDKIEEKTQKQDEVEKDKN